MRSLEGRTATVADAAGPSPFEARRRREHLRVTDHQNENGARKGPARVFSVCRDLT
jgi:hypothetical protein